MTVTKSIEQRQDEIVEEFEKLPDWDARYKHIIDMGKAQPGISDEHKTEDNKVKGCQSTVWMHAELDEDNNMVIQAESDAMIVNGLIAMLLKVYSGHPPSEIMNARPTFIERLDLGQHISMQRQNGLAAMLKQIQFYALAFNMKLSAS